MISHCVVAYMNFIFLNSAHAKQQTEIPFNSEAK